MKKIYSAPELSDYGHVSDLTLGTGGDGFDVLTGTGENGDVVLPWLSVAPDLRSTG